MKGKKLKKTLTLENIIRSVIDAVVSVVISLFSTPVITCFQSEKSGEVTIKAFFGVMLIFAVLLFCICHRMVLELSREYKKYRQKSKDLDRNCVEDVEKQKLFGYEKRDLKEDFLARCLVCICRKMFKALPVCISAYIFYSFNPNVAHAWWEWVQDMGKSKVAEDVQKDENIDKPAGEKNAEEDAAESGDGLGSPDEALMPEQLLFQERDEAWQFILDDFYKTFELEDERERQAFFYFDKDCPGEEEVIQKSVEQWQLQAMKGVDYAEVKDEIGNSYYTYTDADDSFKAKISAASIYISYEKWLLHAPHSMEMDGYIRGREALNRVEMDGEKGCYEIWWFLAKDYLFYAQEYETQTENEEAILYFYVNSIYCCMEALKYTISQEEYNRTYHYMVMRYHDMARRECVISLKYKDMADTLYKILVKKDVLDKQNK